MVVIAGVGFVERRSLKETDYLITDDDELLNQNACNNSRNTKLF
jgi:hypothetical protein